MPYIGNTPAEKYAAFNVQNFTTSATTSYTLDRAVANELDIRLVINNVIQQPGVGKAYTAAGTTLTLSGATSGTDTMYAVYIGKAVQTVNPGAGSVGTTALADSSVTEAKLNVSNSPTNGYVLSAQSGATGGLTWAVDAGGAALTGSTNNTVTTVTGANAIQGETNFIYNGTIVGAGADGANADLGEGIHIKTSDIGSVTVDANGKGLVIEKSGSTGLSIITPNDQSGNIFFGDPEEGSQGQIYYSHNDDSMHFKTGATEKLHLTNAGSIFFPQASQGVYLGVTSVTAANLLDDYEEGIWTPSWSAGGGSLTGTSSNYGKYTKIGDMVSLWFGATIDSGTASGYYRITNAPFTSTTNGSGSYVNSQSGYMGTVWWDSGGATVNMAKYDGTLETDPNLKVNIIMKV